MAARAGCRRVLEDDCAWALSNNGPMAFEALHGPMRAEQYIFCGGMIERGGLFPGRYIVTDLAAPIVGGCLQAVVWILVAIGAGERLKMILRRHT